MFFHILIPHVHNNIPFWRDVCASFKVLSDHKIVSIAIFIMMIVFLAKNKKNVAASLQPNLTGATKMAMNRDEQL